MTCSKNKNRLMHQHQAALQSISEWLNDELIRAVIKRRQQERARISYALTF